MNESCSPSLWESTIGCIRNNPSFVSVMFGHTNEGANKSPGYCHRPAVSAWSFGSKIVRTRALKINCMLALLAVVFLALASCNRNSQPPRANGVQQGKTMRPALPTNGFIKGRTATKEDLATGNTAFLLVTSEAMEIEIPQYAYHVDTQTGKSSAGIIFQAERTPDGKQLLAMQLIGEGGKLVALLAEFKLLGKVAPKSE